MRERISAAIIKILALAQELLGNRGSGQILNSRGQMLRPQTRTIDKPSRIKAISSVLDRLSIFVLLKTLLRRVNRGDCGARRIQHALLLVQRDKCLHVLVRVQDAGTGREAVRCSDCWLRDLMILSPIFQIINPVRLGIVRKLRDCLVAIRIRHD